jgi:hypothetical protein
MRIRIRKTLGIIINFWQHYRAYMIGAVVLAMFGHSALQFRSIFTPPVDEERLTQRMDELRQNQVRFDEETLKELRRRSLEGPSTAPSSAGDPNPFD